MIIAIKKLPVSVYLGIYPEEQKASQDVMLNVAITVSDSYKAGSVDDIDLTVNYASVVEVIDEAIKNQSIGLVETLVERVGQMILEKFSLAQAVEVEATKSVFHDRVMRGAVVSVKKGFSRES